MAISIRKLAKAHNLRQRELAEILNTDQSVVSLLVNGHRRLTEDHIELLRARFGDDELNKFIVAEDEVQRKSVELTLYSPELIDDNRDELREEIADGALAPVIVPTAIMQRPECDAKEWVKSHEAASNADRLQIAEILHATDMVWRVDDCAMQPTLFLGEYVLIKEMDDESQIVDGRVYAIDTIYHGNLIRRVYDDGEAYRLEPINKDGYSAISVDKKKGINRRYRILCHLSTDISMMPDVEEERNRQDRLIEMVNKAGNRVDRLLTMLEKEITL